MMTKRPLLAAIGARGALLSVAFGVFIGFGQAPYGAWPVALLGLALAFLRFHQARGSKAAFAQGFWTGFGYALLVMFWITEPFLVDAQTFGWLAPFGLAGMAAGFGVFWGLGFWGGYRLAGQPTGVALVLGWSLAEIARSLVFTGLPWGLISYIWVGLWPYDWASVVGPFGVGIVTLALAGLLAQFLRKPGWRQGAVLAGLALLLTAGGAIVRPSTESLTGRPIVRLVQPNAPQHLKWLPEYQQVFFDRLLDMSAQPGAPDLVVWPEVAVTFPLNGDDAPFAQISDAVGDRPIVLGGLRVQDQKVLNSMLVLDRAGVPVALYDKFHLVPFGEYAPGGEMMRDLGLRGLAERLEFGFVPGPGPQMLNLPGGLTALPMICYEAIFPHELRRAGPDRPDVMLHLTNDAWFGEGAGPAQHLAQARARAVEFGLPVVRVANTGISAMIGPDGTITDKIALGQAGWLDAPLPMARPATLYWRFGDNPAYFLVIVLALVVIWRRARNRIDPLGQSL